MFFYANDHLLLVLFIMYSVVSSVPEDSQVLLGCLYYVSVQHEKLIFCQVASSLRYLVCHSCNKNIKK